MFLKIILVPLAICGFSLVGQAHEGHSAKFGCNLADPSKGSAVISYDTTTRVLKIQSQSKSLSQFQGIEGQFVATPISEEHHHHAGHSHADDVLIHFGFGPKKEASIRFFGQETNGHVTVAEFIPSEVNNGIMKIDDFVLVCCKGKVPSVVADEFSCTGPIEVP